MTIIRTPFSDVSTTTPRIIPVVVTESEPLNPRTRILVLAASVLCFSLAGAINAFGKELKALASQG